MSTDSEREALARAYDPEAFDLTFKKSDRPVAQIQWAARRKLATDAAERAWAVGYRPAREVAEECASWAEDQRPEVGMHINISQYRDGKFDALTILAARIRAAFPAPTETKDPR
jgi:uncharacterized caspase-like protein